MPPFSTVWQYYTTEQWTDNEGRVRRTSTCNFCNKTYRSNATKMTLHLVKQCRPCPEHIKVELGRLVDDGSHDEVEVALVIPQPVEPVKLEKAAPPSPPKPVYRSIQAPPAKTHTRWFKDTKAVWKHFVTETHIDEHGNSKSTSYCMYCNLRYTFPNVTKMRKHLLVKCRQCPQEVINEVGGGSPAFEQRWSTNPSTSTTPAQPSTSTQFSSTQPTQSTQPSDPPAATSTAPPAPKKICLESPPSQLQLPQAIKKTPPLRMTPGENKKVDAAIARAVYSSDTPLNFAENFYWKEAFKLLRITYTPPTKNMLTGELLEEEYKRVSGKVFEKVCTAGCVGIISDGWADTTGQSRINFTVSTPLPVFLKSIEAKEKECSAAYIAEVISGVIQEVGAGKVLLVLTDNTSSSMRAAWQLIVQQFPHITTASCAGYNLGGLLDDIMKLDTLKTLSAKARNVVQNIKGSQLVYDALKAKQEEKQGKDAKLLHLPSKMQHGGVILMLESLLACKDSLQEILSQDGLNVEEEISTTLLDNENFWMSVESCMGILQPVASALTKVTSAKALLSDIPQEFSKIMTNITERLEASPLTSPEKILVQQSMEERRSFCCFSIHSAANLLDPRYRGQALNEDEIAGAMDFIIRFSLHLNLDAGKVMASLAEFQAQEGRLWSIPSVWAAANHTEPSIWWKGMCGTQKVMPIAYSLLCIPPTSSVSMRKRCSMGDNYSNLRGSLSDAKKQKIIAIRSNLHLFREGYNFLEDDYSCEDESNLQNVSDSEDDQVNIQLNQINT